MALARVSDYARQHGVTVQTINAAARRGEIKRRLSPRMPGTGGGKYRIDTRQANATSGQRHTERVQRGRFRADQREQLTRAKIKLVAARATLTQLKVEQRRLQLIDRVEAERNIGLVVKEANRLVGRMTLGHQLSAELEDLLAEASFVIQGCDED